MEPTVIRELYSKLAKTLNVGKTWRAICTPMSGKAMLPLANESKLLA